MGRTATDSLLPPEAKTNSRGSFQSRMLLPQEGSPLVIQEIRGEPGTPTTIRDCLRGARLHARLVRQTMKDWGSPPLTLRPACVLGVFFVKKKKETASCSLLIAGKRTLCSLLRHRWHCLSGGGLSRIEVDTFGLVHGDSPGLHHGWCRCLPTSSTGCVSLGRSAIFSVGQGVEQKISS